jgi:hypothetical protein
MPGYGDRLDEDVRQAEVAAAESRETEILIRERYDSGGPSENSSAKYI